MCCCRGRLISSPSSMPSTPRTSEGFYFTCFSFVIWCHCFILRLSVLLFIVCFILRVIWCHCFISRVFSSLFIVLFYALRLWFLVSLLYVTCFFVVICCLWFSFVCLFFFICFLCFILSPSLFVFFGFLSSVSSSLFVGTIVLFHMFFPALFVGV